MAWDGLVWSSIRGTSGHKRALGGTRAQKVAQKRTRSHKNAQEGHKREIKTLPRRRLATARPISSRHKGWHKAKSEAISKYQTRAPYTTKWHKMAQASTRWHKKAQDGTSWHKSAQNGARWHK